MSQKDRETNRKSALENLKHTTEIAPHNPVLSKTFTVIRAMFTCPDCKHLGPTAIMEHPLFEYMSAIMIIFSALLMGSEVEISTRHFEPNDQVDALIQCCSIYFILELVLRFLALKSNFLKDDSRYWNALDTFFVVVSISELILATIELQGTSDTSDSKAQIGPIKTTVKMIKMVRLIRVFRIFRFWRGLWDFTLMIIHSMKSLFMAIILLSLIAYVFAVCLTMNSADWLKASLVASGKKRCKRLGPSLFFQWREGERYPHHVWFACQISIHPDTMRFRWSELGNSH